jgi:hypothetical protein
MTSGSVLFKELFWARSMVQAIEHLLAPGPPKNFQPEYGNAYL